jgi:hypothetical protein
MTKKGQHDRKIDTRWNDEARARLDLLMENAYGNDIRGFVAQIDTITFALFLLKDGALETPIIQRAGYFLRTLRGVVLTEEDVPFYYTQQDHDQSIGKAQLHAQKAALLNQKDPNGNSTPHILGDPPFEGKGAYQDYITTLGLIHHAKTTSDLEQLKEVADKLDEKIKMLENGRSFGS